MAHRECSLILERSTWLGPFQAYFGSVQVRTWKSKISVQFLPGTKSVDPDLPRQCPFPSVSLAHDVPCSTLGRTVNELEWALHNPLVWVIDSIMHSTKIGREFGMLRTRHDSGVFGMLSTRHEGNPSWTEGSRMLAMFDHVPTVHKSLGGLEHMERPSRSFGRKLDLLTVGNCAEPKWPTGSVHLS